MVGKFYYNKWYCWYVDSFGILHLFWSSLCGVYLWLWYYAEVYKKSEKRPAKLFYTIYNGKDAILNIELRYKGSKTVEPQFQATATAHFKNLFGE